MREETIRYKVEIDPNQIDSQLASVRTYIGGGLSGGLGGPSSFGNQVSSDLANNTPSSFSMFAHRVSSGIGAVANRVSGAVSYGMELAQGAVNEISSDLHKARESIGPVPTFKDASRGVIEGGIEAVTTAASVGIPLTMASAYMFGAGNTASGIAAGLGMIGRGGIMGARALGTAGVLAGQSAGMAAGALMNPTAAVMAGAYATGRFATQVGENVIEDFRAGNIIEDVFSSRGMEHLQAAQQATRAVSAGRDINLGGASMVGILQGSMNAGLIGGPGSVPGNMGKELVEIAKTAKNMAEALNASISEAIQHISELKKAGITASSQMGVTLGAQNIGSVTGLGTSKALSTGAFGSAMATNFALSGEMGANVAMESAAMAQVGARDLTPALASSVGGVGGLAQTYTRTRVGLMSSNYVRNLISGGDIEGFSEGKVGVSELFQRGAEKLAKVGIGGHSKYLLDMDKRQSQLTDADQKEIELGTITQMSEMFGLNIRDESDRASLALGYGKLAGIDTSTSAGRAQAMSMMNSILDPSVGARRRIETENRISSEMAEDYGIVGTFRSAISRPISRFMSNVGHGIAEGIRDKYEEGVEFVTEVSGDVGRGARSAVRAIGPEGLVRSEYEEQYKIRLPAMNETTRMAYTGAMETLAKKSGMSVEEYKKSISISTGFSAEEVSEAARIKKLFSEDVDLSKESPEFKKQVAAAKDILEKNKGFKREGSFLTEGYTPDQESVLAAIESRSGGGISQKAMATAANLYYGSVKETKKIDVDAQDFAKKYKEVSDTLKTKIDEYTDPGSLTDTKTWARMVTGEYAARKSTNTVIGDIKKSGMGEEEGIMMLHGALSGEESERDSKLAALRKAMGADSYGKLITTIDQLKASPKVFDTFTKHISELSEISAKKVHYANLKRGSDADTEEQVNVTSGAMSSPINRAMDEARVQLLESLVKANDKQISLNDALLKRLDGQASPSFISFSIYR